MPIPLDPRKKTHGRENSRETARVWTSRGADGHESHFDFPYLRDNCPCATCNDERGRNRPLREQSRALGRVADVQAQAARAVGDAGGHYAIQINFTDGHSTGIFSYDYLRLMCPCAGLRQGISQRHHLKLKSEAGFLPPFLHYTKIVIPTGGTAVLAVPEWRNPSSTWIPGLIDRLFQALQFFLHTGSSLRIRAAIANISHRPAEPRSFSPPANTRLPDSSTRWHDWGPAPPRRLSRR